MKNDPSDAEEWLEQNHPQNGVCQIDDPFQNKGKKRNEIAYLYVHQKNLTGILDLSSFSNLELLHCLNTGLTSLSVSNCLNLKRINCFGNQLTNIDFSNCLYLEQLYCFNNKLTSLSVNDCLNLKELCCYNNQLTSLNLPKKNNLTSVFVSDNCLTTFNYNCLNPLTLKDLKIHNNNLAATDLQVFAPFINLTDLRIGNSDY